MSPPNNPPPEWRIISANLKIEKGLGFGLPLPKTKDWMQWLWTTLGPAGGRWLVIKEEPNAWVTFKNMDDAVLFADAFPKPEGPGLGKDPLPPPN